MPPKKLGPRSSSRRLSPQSPVKAASQPRSPTTRRTVRPATRDNDAPIQPVPEHLYPGTNAAPAEIEIQDSAPSQAPSDESSDSQGELDALSSDLIIESLQDLHADAVKLLANFQSLEGNGLAQYIASLRDPKSASTRRLSILLRKLLATREAFGGRVWALPAVIVRKLRNALPFKTIPDGTWRPDAILYMANLAQFVGALTLPHTTTTGTMIDAFSHFPVQFSAQEINRFASNDHFKLLQIGDAIRTQFFIRQVREQQGGNDFDPDKTMTAVFFDTEYSTRTANSMERLGQAYTSAFQTRLNKIREAFNTSDNSVDLDMLQGIFPWDAFVVQFVQWALFRQQELEGLIQAENGDEAIINAIQTGAFNVAASIPAPTLHSTAARVRGSGGRKPKNTAKAIAALKKKDAARTKQAPPSTAPPPAPVNANLFDNEAAAAAALLAYNQGQDGNIDYAGFDDDAPHSAQPPAPTQMTMAEAQELADLQAPIINDVLGINQQANKENNPSRQITKSFMAPQANARRVPFDDDSELAGPSGTNKRQATADDEDEDEFEADNRPEKKQRVNKGKARAVQEPSPILGEAYPYPSTQPASARSPLRQHMQPPSSTAPTLYPGSLPPSSQYGQINALAKQNVALTRELSARHIIQSRRPYSVDETNRLIDLIALNQGPKYAKILKDDRDHPDGAVLQARTQVQLKDKARNIKMDFLKARVRLPEGFANVSIGKRLVGVLEGMGVGYVDGEGEGGESVLEDGAAAEEG